jgi:hypothetical protein
LIQRHSLTVILESHDAAQLPAVYTAPLISEPSLSCSCSHLCIMQAWQQLQAHDQVCCAHT